MDLYPGLLLHKIRSDRVAQVAGLNRTHAYLTYTDDGKQTRVRLERFNRLNEWELLAGYQEETTA